MAEQWENVRSDASSTVSKINSYRKLTPLCLKDWEGGSWRRLCDYEFSMGDVGADQSMAKCFSRTFIVFDSDDNVVRTE